MLKEGLKNTAFAVFSDLPDLFFVGVRGFINRLDAKKVNPFPQAPNLFHFLEIP